MIDNDFKLDMIEAEAIVSAEKTDLEWKSII